MVYRRPRASICFQYVLRVWRKSEPADRIAVSFPVPGVLMSVSYTCPNAACGVTLKTPAAVPAGKKVKCPKCKESFAPVPEEAPPAAAGAGTFKFADDDGKKPAAPPPPAKKPDGPKKTQWQEEIENEESDESIKKGYGVVQETEEEVKKAHEAKVNFGAVEDKYKKSARGPAVALLVVPSSLLTGEGLLTAIGGLVMFVVGFWPLAFNDAPAGDEETEEAIVMMLLGCLTFLWGAVICFGASQMQELGSYMWAMLGAVMGILPLLVGIFAIIILQSPEVKAGFAESDAGVEEDDEGEKKDDDDDDDDDDDEEDEDEEDEED
jgi:hypothetical protein